MDAVLSLKGSKVRLKQPGQPLKEFPLSDLSLVIRDYPDARLSEELQEYRMSKVSLKDAPRDLEVPARYDGETSDPHQIDCISITGLKKHMVIAIDTGGGKTSTGLLRSKALGARKVLVVLPLPTIANWANEIKMVLGPKKVTRYRGTIKQREKIASQWDFDLILCNYEMLDELSERLPEIDAIIVDEAHLVSRQGNDRHAAMEKLIKRFPDVPRLLLTGTPILKEVEDLYHLIKLCDKRVAGFKKDWMEAYREVDEWRIVPIRRGSKTIYLEEPQKWHMINHDQCHQHIAPVVYRVPKEAFATYGTPEHIVWCNKTDAQSDLYQAVREETLIEWEGGRLDYHNALTKILYLQEISEGVWNIDKKLEGSGKEDFLDMVIREKIYQGIPIVIFGRFITILKRLYERYMPYAVINTGEQSEAERTLARLSFNGVQGAEQEAWDEAVAKVGRWDKKPGEPLLYLSTLSFSTSIGNNLQRRCSEVWFPTFHGNGDVNDQAIARVARRGQKADVVNSYFLLTEDTVDHHYFQIVKKQQADKKAILDQGSLTEVQETYVDMYMKALKENK